MSVFCAMLDHAALDHAAANAAWIIPTPNRFQSSCMDFREHTTPLPCALVKRVRVLTPEAGGAMRCEDVGSVSSCDVEAVPGLESKAIRHSASWLPGTVTFVPNSQTDELLATSNSQGGASSSSSAHYTLVHKNFSTGRDLGDVLAKTLPAAAVALFALTNSFPNEVDAKYRLPPTCNTPVLVAGECKLKPRHVLDTYPVSIVSCGVLNPWLRKITFISKSSFTTRTTPKPLRNTSELLGCDVAMEKSPATADELAGRVRHCMSANMADGEVETHVIATRDFILQAKIADASKLFPNHENAAALADLLKELLPTPPPLALLGVLFTQSPPRTFPKYSKTVPSVAEKSCATKL